MALGMMRKFFLDDFTDEFYRQKIARAVFIGLACVRPCCEECFCYEMGAGPNAQEGFDLQLTSIDRGCLLEVGSKKGGSIVKKYKKLFVQAGPLQEKEARAMLKDFCRQRKKIDYKKLSKIIKEDKVKESIWDDIGLRCVICSGCITLCPTCSCFSIADRLEGDKGMRMRYCDGCPYAGFTKLAGNNIPQPLHKDHIRRFFEHKLNVDVWRYGRPSCVGCGRCILTCPGNISIRKFIEQAVDGL
jgi:formate hydrogenlyase subunit 6/NADH:ubiquinone oxidoreductase subunit I